MTELKTTFSEEIGFLCKSCHNNITALIQDNKKNSELQTRLIKDMDNKLIYLDYMATTPVDPLVVSSMLRYLGADGIYANPASNHPLGQEAAIAIALARQQIADSVGADSEALIFTSGATEANNLAILGAAHFYQRKGRHLITMTTEHKSVLDVFKKLEKLGFRISYLPPLPSGLLDLNLLEQHLCADTILVSVMHVNNEIGVVQDIASIGQLLKDKGIIFHVDAAQSAGKLAIDLNNLPVHLMSFSAHKNYGPKGVGALFIRQKPRIRIEPLFFGGDQERGLRPGTLPTHQIVGMGTAFSLSESKRVEEQARILTLREYLHEQLLSIPHVQINGCLQHRVAGNLNISVAGIDGSALLSALYPLIVSSSSACMAHSHHPSYVLRALGLSAEMAKSSVRISIGRFTTRADIDQAVDIFQNLQPI